MELTSENVENILRDCLFSDSEIKNGKPSVEPVIVAGIVNSYGFHPVRLQSHKREIKSMLAQLPKEFFVDTGGGWSFLHLCMRADGAQWTGLHQTQERLAALGIALGIAAWIPELREFWTVLPGGVPYFQVNFSGEGNGSTDQA